MYQVIDRNTGKYLVGKGVVGLSKAEAEEQAEIYRQKGYNVVVVKGKT